MILFVIGGVALLLYAFILDTRNNRKKEFERKQRQEAYKKSMYLITMQLNSLCFCNEAESNLLEEKLILAIDTECFDLVKELVEVAGARWDELTKRGNAYAYAHSKGHIEVVDYFYEKHLEE